MTTHEVQPDEAGARIDVWLAAHYTDLSRARWQDLVRTGHVRVNGTPTKSHRILHVHDRIDFEIPPPEPVVLVPEPIALDILHEDADIMVVNKSPQLVVHPAPGHATGTLVNALLHHCHDLAGVGGELRPGIVHRLDRDTSGVMVVAKNDLAMKSLGRQFRSRTVRKEYVALVRGHPKPLSATLETLIGRSEHDRKKMSATPRTGRQAVTRYETMEHLGDATLLRIDLETGRTHQIRVHMAHAGHPVLGDRQYGRKRADLEGVDIPRQMLHARVLAFDHPRSEARVDFEAPIPPDMRAVICALRSEPEAHARV